MPNETTQPEGTVLSGQRRASSVNYLWLLVFILFSLLVAVVAGVLRRSTGTGLAETILYGGGVFAAALGLCLAVRAAVRTS